LWFQINYNIFNILIYIFFINMLRDVLER